MQVYEFTEKLAEKFPKSWKQIDNDDIEAFIGERGLSPEQIEKLYAITIQTYPPGWRTFPTLSFIRALCDQMAAEGKLDGKFDGADHGIDDGAALDVETILARMKTLRDNQDRRDLTSSEIDFLHAWDALPYVSDHLNHEWPGETHRINSYLKTIKEQILRRERINFSGLPGMNLKVEDKPRLTKKDEPRRFENPVTVEDMF